MIFPRRIPGANAFVAALLLFALFHPAPAGAIGGPQPVPVAVEGEVRRPGSYTLPHDATLSTLIVAAGGTTDNADLAAATPPRESEKPVAAPLPPPPDTAGEPGPHRRHAGPPVPVLLRHRRPVRLARGERADQRGTRHTDENGEQLQGQGGGCQVPIAPRGEVRPRGRRRRLGSARHARLRLAGDRREQG